ncbi:TadE/TadG family type IV pilus assembly protein [Photobacterium leiognathi]|uniref:TadE/TadG family type IV pilus assembly protein n=1 Tax=Photobacterium leiognathi TaxID=553611 RepID=UPI002980E2DE|nr:pilus assembly protein TadG-related protein [Photobacterium leiognathi]
MKKQQGVAAIILVLVLIPLFGSVFFALESTRYIQKKTRLADATEAAALAVTNQNPEKLTIAENNKESQSLTPLTTRDNLAFAYINSYVRNINQDNIIITPEIVINKNQDSDGKSYYQYNVNVTTTHNSWFVNELIPSFNPTQKITATALARNYPRLTGDQPIDLVFVADFSGSMAWDLSVPRKNHIIINYNNKSCKAYFKYEYGNYYRYQCNELDNNGYYIYKDINNRPQKKITALRNSINIISEEILKNKDNRISFTAFSSYTYEKNNSTYKRLTNLNCERTSVIIKINNNHDSDYYNYNDYNHYKQYQSEYDDFYKNVPSCQYYNEPCINLNNNKIYYNNRRYSKEKFFKNYLHHHGLTKIIPYLCHYNNMVNDLFIKKPRSSYAEYIYNDSIYNIDLISNEETIINGIYSMAPQNSTSAYEGIMRGAQILNKGKYNNNDSESLKGNYNKRKKILILLSDGVESEPKILTNLVNNNLCKKIRENFSSSNNKMFMGMVGIGYKASDNDVFHQCFDENIYNSEHQLISESNIIDVDDLSTLTDKIKELIRKGQQTDGISKLSDGQN